MEDGSNSSPNTQQARTSPNEGSRGCGLKLCVSGSPDRDQIFSYTFLSGYRKYDQIKIK